VFLGSSAWSAHAEALSCTPRLGDTNQLRASGCGKHHERWCASSPCLFATPLSLCAGVFVAPALRVVVLLQRTWVCCKHCKSALTIWRTHHHPCSYALNTASKSIAMLCFLVSVHSALCTVSFTDIT